MGQAMSNILDQIEDVFHTYLILYLLEFVIEKPTAYTVHRSYLDILPQGIDSMSSLPVTWSLAEAKELLNETSILYQYQKNQRKEYLSDYNLLKENIPGFSQFTYEQYLWARLIVLSRSFDWENEADPGLALVPFADMMSHAASQKSNGTEGSTMEWDFNHTSKTYRAYTVRDVAAGEEVTITYMDACNSRLLSNYGFTMEENSDHNSVQIVIPIRNERDPLFGKENARSFQIILDVYAKETYGLLSYLRYMHEDSDQTIQNESHDFEENEIAHSTIEVEIAMLGSFQKICRTALSKYSSTAAQDMIMLRNITAFPYGSKQRNARNILLAEKKILGYYIHDFTTTMMGWLEKDRDVVIQEMKERYQHEKEDAFSDEHHYARDIVLDLL